MDRFISNQIRKKDLLLFFEKKYHLISPLWSIHQLEWVSGVYQSYKDHEKYMIVLYLIKKTFDFYSKNLVKENFTEFFEKDFIEVDSFTIMEVSKAIDITKESTRRKINELEKSGAIKRIKRRTIIDKSMFPFMKPQKSIIRISRFLSTISNILYQGNILQSEFESIKIEDFIKNNFSLIWKLYYEVQIPNLLKWKKVFKDLETFHVWAVCVVNQKLNSQKNPESNNKISKKKYLDRYFFNDDNVIDGVNAMSISDISGIPRATVIRKLNILIEKKYLVINDKKHYTLANTHQKKLSSIQEINLSFLYEFIANVFNLILIDQGKI
jgi:DNA-binding Lrp family transcriptional regulator|tara:strand:+ start:22 stop:996 length:975 start_codon:yes stop_codon:yes gene_type:complete